LSIPDFEALRLSVVLVRIAMAASFIEFWRQSLPAQVAKEPPTQTAKQPPTRPPNSLWRRRLWSSQKLMRRPLPITKDTDGATRLGWPLVLGRYGSRFQDNEVVRVDPVRNAVQARVPVDKEPCYGIGVGVDRVVVLNCQGKT